VHDRNWFFLSLERLHYSKILGYHSEGHIRAKVDVTTGRAACEARSATCNCAMNSDLFYA
jgi:hypothetical protein